MSVGPPNSDWRPAHERGAGPAPSRLGYHSGQTLDPEAERTRRELDTAIEDELHQIVAKTGREHSGPWRRAEPPREEADRTRRFRLPWILASVVLILALSIMGYQVLRKLPTAELPEAVSLGGLGLKAEMKRNLVHVSWDKKAPLIASAKRGVLSIKDGTFQNDLILGADLLSRGSVNYYHKTNNITFHLQVVTGGSRTTSEVVELPAGSEVGAPISIDLGPQRRGLLASPENSNSARTQAAAIPPQLASNNGTDKGTIEGVAGLVPERPAKTALHSPPQPLPREISAPTVENKEPTAIASDAQDLTALKLAKAGVPQTWKLVVEYLGLTPTVLAQSEAMLSSGNPVMKLLQGENAGTIQLQAVTPPSDEPPASLPTETPKDVSLVEETPVAASAVPLQNPVVRDSAVAATPERAIGSTVSSLVQCPENSVVREIPFASGRPDRRTVVCGETVTILRESGDWVRIKTADGFEGHILRRYVK